MVVFSETSLGCCFLGGNDQRQCLRFLVLDSPAGRSRVFLRD